MSDDLKERLRDLPATVEQHMEHPWSTMLEAADALDARDAEIARLREALRQNLESFDDIEKAASNGDASDFERMAEHAFERTGAALIRQADELPTDPNARGE